ncbi:DUF6984 family protein [Acinetobacter rathckeae]|uniref:DUF6984 family protein n=1 Tax=Acinetobacter rathckeae TaxID=2605272 RepID=UPI0018A27396|nr:hypothetical protein [Acinetobacter rathckeae]MBF7688936.1 hypothetical protein [Acinetobacter rathckeae]MBF7696335.1 hypothetical protein [Acinetobacter rathckeae]
MRLLTSDEIFIIKSLINISPIKINVLVPLPECYAMPLNDGAMGSFKIIYPSESNSSDGVLVTSQTQIDYLDENKQVNVTLFIDQRGIAREVDSFVEDFSALTKPFNIKNIRKTYALKP